MQVKEQPKVGPKGEPSGSERVKELGEHGDKKMQKVAFGFQVCGFKFSLSFTRLGGHRPPLEIPAASYPSRATTFPQFCKSCHVAP
jgi:hypothetical protein